MGDNKVNFVLFLFMVITIGKAQDMLTSGPPAELKLAFFAIKSLHLINNILLQSYTLDIENVYYRPLYSTCTQY